MVEGPGATRNGHRAQAFLRREIVSVQCNCNDNILTKNNDDGSPWFNGRFLSEVFSIGKELWLIFSRTDSKVCDDDTSNGETDFAIMLHFGMNGSLRINSSYQNNSHQSNQSLCMGFGDSVEYLNYSRSDSTHSPSRIDMIQTYQTTVHGPVSAVTARKKYANLTSVDVCSLNFNAEQVLMKIKSNQNENRVISDVILDQHIYPGVGNIIKVEGLHQSGINPKQIMSKISDSKLHSLIKACRTYAMEWLYSGKAPSKCVYNQTICKSCNKASISMQRVGASHRTTFWCIGCQPMVVEERPQLKDTSNNLMPTTGAIRRVCPTHGPDYLILRRARKGINASRIFHTCKGKNCNFFSWADTNFPKCKCKKRTILLISKTEKTGGKWFFTCSAKSGKCGYFSWAKSTDLERFGEKLHPLL